MKEVCIRSAMAGGLDRESAEEVVSALIQEKNRLRAEKAAAPAEAELAAAWGRIMEENKLANIQQRRHAALNIRIRREIDTRLAAAKAEGFSTMDFIESLTVGSNKRFFGARDSIDARRIALWRDYAGGLMNSLESLSPTINKLFREDPDFNANVIRELTQPGSTKDSLARQAAEIFSNYLEDARTRRNDAGAAIGKLDGYIPQSHDAWKLTAKRKDGRSPRSVWIETMLTELDIEKSFPDIAGDIHALHNTLDDIYDTITLGKDTLAHGLGTTEHPTPPRNLANRMGQHRVLHFKDADAFMQYNAEYGKGGIFEGIMHHLDTASRDLALMEALGPNPGYMLRSIIQDEINATRKAFAGTEITPAQQKDLQVLHNTLNASGDFSGKVGAWMAELTGEANWPAHTTAARAAAIARATQTLSKLGGAALSATADVFIKAMNMRVHGLTWGEALTGSLEQYFRLYKGQEREVARQLGTFIDSVNADMRLRWDVNESIPGKMAGLQDKLFKWSGLNWITESGKAGYAMWFSGHMGESTGLRWGELDTSRRATLEHHGFNASRWGLLQHMTESLEDGRVLLSPQQATKIPDSVLRSALKDELATLRQTFNTPEQLTQAEQALFTRTRRELRTDVMAMIADETMYAIIEPDAKTRAFMRQGTRPGTLPGEMWRFMTQFKSFPIAYMQRQMGGRRWVRSDLQKGMEYGFTPGSMRDAVTRDMQGVVGATLSAFTFGYIAMTAKDIARGKTPRDPRKPETVMAALMQSGGAGILGDFFFDKVSRFGDSFTGTLAGPVLGETGRAVTVLGQLLRGDFKEAGSDGLRLVMDNAPFVNLWYTREALNIAFMYHIREMLSPGTLERTERKMREEYGQEFIFAPSGIIRTGGGFR